MPINQIRIPQAGSANNAPGSDGTPGPYQTDSTLVPNPGKADGKIGTGSNVFFIPSSTPVPGPGKANDIVGTGSNAVFISGSTPVPHSNRSDGLDGSWSAVPFQGGLPTDGTPIPHPGGADDH